MSVADLIADNVPNLPKTFFEKMLNNDYNQWVFLLQKLNEVGNYLKGSLIKKANTLPSWGLHMPSAISENMHLFHLSTNQESIFKIVQSVAE